MSTPRDYLADPYSLTDAELQALLSLAIAFHHAPRIAYAERMKQEDQA